MAWKYRLGERVLADRNADRSGKAKVMHSAWWCPGKIVGHIQASYSLRRPREYVVEFDDGPSVHLTVRQIRPAEEHKK